MNSLPSSSSSTTSSDNSPVFQGICQVCFQPGHGTHFGAYSCRACSAFFRRAILANYHNLKCKLADGNCQPKRNGRFNCKRCRLQKCFDSGMSVDKLQFDRDLISSTEQFMKKQKMISNIPHSLEGFLGRPSFIFSCEPDLASSKRTLIDLQFLIDHASNIFISNNESRRNNMLIGMSTLERLSYAIDLQRVPTIEKPLVCTKIGKEEMMVFWENKFIATANWLTYCDEFQQLPQEMKLEFLKSIWYVWMKIEKIGKSAEQRMKSDEIESICHIINNIYIDLDNVEIETSWMSNYSWDQLQYFLEKPSPMYKNNIVEPLVDIRASPQEITYLICIVSFRYAAKQSPGPIAELSENLMDRLADDLHNYYFNEFNLKNYASRLARIMRIVQFVEQDIYERKERAEVARVFNIFNIEFSHPEMFIGI